MDESRAKTQIEEITNSLGSSGITRRDFLKYTGAAGAAVASIGLVGCDDDEGPVDGGDPNAVYLGTGDTAVLNYAYALEQLEAAFYAKAASTLYSSGGSGIAADHPDVFANIRDHEAAHAAFFNAALGDNAIPALTPNFDMIDFSDETQVVATALTFENVGVSAYNGAASLLTNTDFLLVAGKIVSVEARHAAAISDLIRPDAGVAGNRLVGDGPIIDSNGLDLARSPSEILPIVAPYIEETFDTSGLPQPQ